LNPEYEALVAYLQDQGASHVYLFGSRARDQARCDSDIDLAVAGVDPSLYFQILGQLDQLASVPVDLVLLDDGSRFAAHIQRKIEKGWAIRVG
jgi:predicted nucleotidyltransferase